MKVAFMYDFDKTLSPLNMQEYNFIPALNMNADEFWLESEKLVKEKGMDQVLAYMYLMIKKAKSADISLTKSSFTSFGKNIQLFKGVDTFFDNINEYAKSIGIELHHYIISSGTKEIIEGTNIGNKFDEIYASSFMYDVDGVAVWPAISINYTNKTQFIYRINKGIFDITDDGVNSHMDDNKKLIPFENMVYFGDGLTDVPCMKLVKQNGGTSIGVYSKESSKEVVNNLLKYDRITKGFMADYSVEGELYKYLQELLNNLKTKE